MVHALKLNRLIYHTDHTHIVDMSYAAFILYTNTLTRKTRIPRKQNNTWLVFPMTKPHGHKFVEFTSGLFNQYIICMYVHRKFPNPHSAKFWEVWACTDGRIPTWMVAWPALEHSKLGGRILFAPPSLSTHLHTYVYMHIMEVARPVAPHDRVSSCGCVSV